MHLKISYICDMAAILSRGRWINYTRPHLLKSACSQSGAARGTRHSFCPPSWSCGTAKMAARFAALQAASVGILSPLGSDNETTTKEGHWRPRVTVMPTSVMRKCRHFDEIFLTDCFGSCHIENFTGGTVHCRYNLMCHQWQQLASSRLSLFSVKTKLCDFFVVYDTESLAYHVNL